MTAADLDALERLLADAPKRLRCENVTLGDGQRRTAIQTSPMHTVGYFYRFGETMDPYAALSVAAVNALPELIAAARERDGWRRAAESQNRQWSQLTEERARCEEVAAQLLATQQDRYRILSERDALRAEVERMRAVVEAARVVFDELDCRGECSISKKYDLEMALSALDAAKEGE